jgi:hypothetical protein
MLATTATQIFQSFFQEDTLTEHGMSIPSIKSHLDVLGYTSYYKNWERAIEDDVLDKLTDPYVKKKFVDTLTHVNKAHLTYHQEPYGWHALCCGLICSHYASLYSLSPKAAFLLGFLHDIGKPFTETPSGKTYMHGQIGVHLAEQVFAGAGPQELTQVLLFLIDQHMCVCTHEPLEQRSHICFSTLQNMITSYSENQRKLYGAYYKCLVYGDRLGAYRPDIYLEKANVDLIQQNAVQHILYNKPLTPHVGSGNLFLVMHGAPGCGKSTMTARFVDALTSKGMTVGVAERDQAYWIVARKQKLIPYDVSFTDFVEKQFTIGEEETTYYKHVYPIIKNQIAEHYRNIILDYSEKYDIVIIDSCISLNQKVLGEFIGQGDTAFVWTGFPQHLLGRKGSYKVDAQTFYPLEQETVYYRSAIEISKDEPIGPTPLVISSCFQELSNLIGACWLTKLQNGPGRGQAIEQVYPSVYINQKSLEVFKQNNPTVVVDTSLKFYAHPIYRVIRLSYYDGKQNGNGTTLHYRGEHLICDPADGMWRPLRMSLPVSPETGQLRKFNSHAGLYEFVKPLQKYLKGEFSEPASVSVSVGAVLPVPYNRCFVAPKVDGSLMNVSAVKKNSVQGAYIAYLKNRDSIEDFYYEIDDTIYYVGSKSCLFASQASSIIEPFKESISASYGSFQAFYLKVHEHLADIPWTESASVVFEAVPTHPYSGLTVDYGRTFVAHLATVYYKDGEAVIRLASASAQAPLHSNPVEEISCSAEAIEAYYCAKMAQALEGSIEDLEGFMLAFTEPGGKLLYMKLKFPWYYAAHKPDIHYSEAEELYVDPKYVRIRERLANLEAAINTAEIKKNPAVILDALSEQIIRSFDKMRQPQDSRKDFMVRMFKMGCLPYEDEITETFNGILAKFYMKMEFNLSKHIASLYDVLTGEDNAKKIAAINAFYVKVLKL